MLKNADHVVHVADAEAVDVMRELRLRKGHDVEEALGALFLAGLEFGCRFTTQYPDLGEKLAEWCRNDENVAEVLEHMQKDFDMILTTCEMPSAGHLVN